MKQKIKLRNLSEKQYKKWFEENKNKIHIESKILDMIVKPILEDFTDYKDIYSEEILDQEIEIEVPELLTKEEKEYLENLLRPFKEVTKYIVKMRNDPNLSKEYILIRFCNGEYITLPYFNFNEYYKNLGRNKCYSIEELGLFKSKYKITLTEFWNSEEKLAIHCDTKEKADKFIKESNKTGKWGNYGTFYEVYKDKTCYSNDSQYCNIEFYEEENYTIYDFDEVDLEH